MPQQTDECEGDLKFQSNLRKLLELGPYGSAMDLTTAVAYFCAGVVLFYVRGNMSPRGALHEGIRPS